METALHYGTRVSWSRRAQGPDVSRPTSTLRALSIRSKARSGSASGPPPSSNKTGALEPNEFGPRSFSIVASCTRAPPIEHAQGAVWTRPGVDTTGPGLVRACRPRATSLCLAEPNCEEVTRRLRTPLRGSRVEDRHGLRSAQPGDHSSSTWADTYGSGTSPSLGLLAQQQTPRPSEGEVSSPGRQGVRRRVSQRANSERAYSIENRQKLDRLQPPGCQLES